MGSGKAVTRERIIETAYGMACESGLASLSVRAVADRCGVATGTMYNHVQDIAELRTEVIRRFWREAIEAAGLESCTRDAGTALDYCRRLSDGLSSSLRGFRGSWLRDMGTLDGKTRRRAAKAELACLQGLRDAVRHAFESDEAIGASARDRVDMGNLADYVWESMFAGVKRGGDANESLFALLDLALYR